MTTQTNGTTTRTPAPTVWPAFQADDAHAMIDFLVDVVGFRRTAVYPEGELVAHAQLDWPEGGGVMLGSRRETSGVAPGIASIYVVTDHVDEVHDRVRDAPGVTITRPPSDTGYGSHEFVMTDPEGNFWSFGTYRGEPS
ncbi:VOC family protein [Microlunatus spumicola]|uniref:VOC family protein n=1 Tax=Microlunatus spumicola TaxID=81499 RepID=A0ABP6XH91_9ACTN